MTSTPLSPGLGGRQRAWQKVKLSTGSLPFCRVLPLALMSSGVFEFVAGKKEEGSGSAGRCGRLDGGAINHRHVAAIKTTLARRTVLPRPPLPLDGENGPLVATARTSETRERCRVRERERCGPPVRGRGAWDAQIKWEAPTRRLRLQPPNEG